MSALVTPLTLMTVVGALLLGGCSGPDAHPSSESTASPTTPSLGGPSPTRTSAPGSAMDPLEQPVAQRLAAQVSGQGLHLDHLDCPHWDGKVPQRLRCRAYVDGLVVAVKVRLHAASGAGDQAVGFDAHLADGLIATRRLEDTLRAATWTSADCGDVAAYPARVDDEIVCRVSRPGLRRYVVATVRDRSGAVSITEWRRPR